MNSPSNSLPPRNLALPNDIVQLAEVANQRLQQKQYAVALVMMQRINALQTMFDEAACLTLAEIAADNFFLPLAHQYCKKILAQKKTSRPIKFKTHLLLSRLSQFFADENAMVSNLDAAKTLCDAKNPAELKMLNRRNYHVALHLIHEQSSPAAVKQAFADMEWRKHISWQTSFVEQDYHQTIPLWNGEDLKDDETLLVSFEQGFGDAVQFSRFVNMIYPRAKKILFEVRVEMLELFSSQFNTAWQGTSDQADILVFPYSCYDQALTHPRVKHLNLSAVKRVFLFSLPALLGLSSPVAPQPYFSFEKLFGGQLPPTPANKPIDKNFDKPRNKPKPKIGLVWSCGQDSNAQDRSVTIKDFLPLLTLPQYEFLALQMPPQNNDIAAAGFHGFVKDATPLVKNFADSAKILHGLDAVVTVDTAIAHLAAAFGKKTFLLVPFIADWRWSDIPHGTPSLWYGKNLFAFHCPQFHQGKHDWHSTIKKLVAHLQKEVA